MNKLYLGIDTSAYTTSVAVVDDNSNIIFDSRMVLEVEKNKRGLRQQDAVFKHMLNLPIIFDEFKDKSLVDKISVVSVSSKPRNVEESYMPVFTVGKGQAYIISKLLHLPFKQFSHQEGHISAGIMNTPLEHSEKFLAFHLSGGTTELLIVENRNKNYIINKIGGTLDISIGQLVDRIGVSLGFQFPCGSKMDLASISGSIINGKLPVSIVDTWGNFSGHENFFNNMINNGKYNDKDIIVTLFHTIYLSLEKIILSACMKYNLKDVLLIGGVASNSYIREKLVNSLSNKNINTYLPNKYYCTDNAVGVAYLGKIKSGHLWRI
ncbi:Kae1-like domain-containing protein [Anaerosalibacter sp. Marseille-P3206]|uniref:Kae1-like domain-containing protein n=1 Tax=Anaerosalibacter sp. Marseille-P3206 TaxID=1871005 RepID=UPI0013563260|nr:O-sialoglycoprotein endopeptidase [Anaerosalibacter sp. Marseille-P3206]